MPASRKARGAGVHCFGGGDSQCRGGGHSRAAIRHLGGTIAAAAGGIFCLLASTIYIFKDAMGASVRFRSSSCRPQSSCRRGVGLAAVVLGWILIIASPALLKSAGKADGFAGGEGHNEEG